MEERRSPRTSPRHLVVPQKDTSSDPLRPKALSDSYRPKLLSDPPKIYVTPDPSSPEQNKWSAASPAFLLSDEVSRMRTEEVFESPVMVKEPSSWATARKEELLGRREVSGSGSIMLKNHLDGRVHYDVLHQKAEKDLDCSQTVCLRSRMAEPVPTKSGIMYDRQDIYRMAGDFLNEYYTAIKKQKSEEHVGRLCDVNQSIALTGQYELTLHELIFGAKLAWRNSPRCIARMQWQNLHVIDGRHVQTTQEMFEILCQHLRHSTNEGNIRPSISIFPPRQEGRADFRVWNALLLRYAGYKQEDGSVIGDPACVEFTEVCRRLGWRGPGGMFDILPWVLQAGDGDPEVYEVPRDLILEVEISHPKYPEFPSLGLKWTSLPAVASLQFDCGGLQFTASPTSGWYLTPEVACRNFGDEARYDCLKKVAQLMGLDTSSYHTMWKDRAMVELTVAVQHSYEKAGVTIQDHHTVSESFQRHFSQEHRVRGGCPSDWVWLVPPVSGSASPLFHQEMLNYYLRPNFLYQVDPWKTYRWPVGQGGREGPLPSLKAVAWSVRFLIRTMNSILERRHKVTVLYATESGRSEAFAYKLGDVMKTAFDVRVLCMDEYIVSQLQDESLVMMVASTTGNGQAPTNGMAFSKKLLGMINPTHRKRSSVSIEMLDKLEEKPLPIQQSKPLKKVRYAVFALGSRAYPAFCAFGRFLDRAMKLLGARSILSLGEGDEMCGQENVFNAWAHNLFKETGKVCQLRKEIRQEALQFSPLEDHTWKPGKFRLAPAASHCSLQQGLASTGPIKNIRTAKILERKQLQSPDSERNTMLLRLELQGPEPLPSYSPGDHVCVFPETPRAVVDAVLARLEEPFDPDSPVTVQHIKRKAQGFSAGGAYEWVNKEGLPVGMSIRTALSRYLDIVSQPTQLLLGAMATFATDDQEAYRLKRLSQNLRDYDVWVDRERPTLAEVLEMFPSVHLPPVFLLSQLPVLQPRMYSISSSQALHPREVHITALLTRYRTQGGKGKERTGLCTGFMNTVSVAEEVFIAFKESPIFHMPLEQQEPLLLIGCGTGIAPLRSFWQQRSVDLEKAQKTGPKFGEITLYFGCRRKDTDHIYAAEIHEAMTIGSLSNLRLALSRQPDLPKTYVQDLLLEDADKIVEILTKRKGHVYVCGDVRVSQGVNQALTTILTKRAGLEPKVAKEFILQMREFGQYHEDIFGASQETLREHRPSLTASG